MNSVPRIRTAARLAVVLLLLATAVTPRVQAQTFSVLYTFGSTNYDGMNPTAPLLRDKAGNLYGTTYNGGQFGYGTVFELDTAGAETVLYSFAGAPDGSSPRGGVVMDGKGNLYGTTLAGGAYGYGTVFKLTPAGKETILHSFTDGSDGASPWPGLLLAGGKLYGTTSIGGDDSCNSPNGCGVVFEMTTKGVETVLHAFDGGNGSDDGAYPYGGVIADSGGNLYGTTYYGGPFYDGVVYELDKSTGYSYTMLLAFQSDVGGGCPYDTLVRDHSGNLYGTAWCNSSGNGLVFEVDPAGVETILHTFAGPPTDGASPQAGLVRDPKGNLYGTAEGGAGVGVVYELAFTKGTFTEKILYTFTGASDGGVPVAGLIRDSTGNLYGTTYQGGNARDGGTIFMVVP